MSVGVTIISTMKPMIEEFIIEQTNAVLSWKMLRIKPNIIIYGDEQGVPDFCQKHNIMNVPNIKRNKYGTPIISDILKQA